MLISDYTDTATIRALLGANVLEVSDEVLNLPIYGSALADGLDRLNPDIATQYAAIKRTAPASRGILQQRFCDQAAAYAAVLLAIQVAPTLPMAAPKTLGDGKATFDRIADPYTALYKSLQDTLGQLGLRLLDTLRLVSPQTAVGSRVKRTYAAAFGLANDPVRGT